MSQEAAKRVAVGVLEAAKSTWILLNTPQTQGDCPCFACGFPHLIRGHPASYCSACLTCTPRPISWLAPCALRAHFWRWLVSMCRAGWICGTGRRHAHLSKQHNPRERKWEAVRAWSGFAGSRGDISSQKAPYPAREQVGAGISIEKAWESLRIPNKADRRYCLPEASKTW